MTGTAPLGVIDRVRRHLEQLNMPRALETLDATLRSVEQGELSALAALEQLLGRGTHHARDAAHQDRPNDRAARLAQDP